MLSFRETTKGTKRKIKLLNKTHIWGTFEVPWSSKIAAKIKPRFVNLGALTICFQLFVYLGEIICNTNKQEVFKIV